MKRVRIEDFFVKFLDGEKSATGVLKSMLFYAILILSKIKGEILWIKVLKKE